MGQTSKRFLTVGSLLRPEALLKYKTEIEHRDDIQYPFYDDIDNYKLVEDEAVKTIVEKELAHDFPEITDGEYSKAMWHLDFLWGFNGVRRFIDELGYSFRDYDDSQSFETRKDIGIDIYDELDGKKHPFIAHFKRLQALTTDQADQTHLKVCIPSPAHIFTEVAMNDKSYKQTYSSEADFKEGLIKAYQDFLKEFSQAGGQILQFDDCLWQLYAEDNNHNAFNSGDKFDEAKAFEQAQKYVDINNVLIDYGHELGLKIYTHNCRGNYASRHASEGSYQTIANFFLKQQKYDRFYLEWDDDRAGDLSALEAFKEKPETEVVLGFLSSKTANLDDDKRALDGLAEASKYVDKDKLYLSHQCGFASCDGGNELTTDNQWDKIKQGQEIAYAFWGE